MRNSSAVKPAQLLSRWTLLLVTLLTIALLVLTYKSEDVFLPDSGKKPDAVSISYAELLLEAHPENQELRLTLIEQLLELQDYPRARRHVRELDASDARSLPFYLAELDVLEALANPQGIDAELRTALVERLAGLNAHDLSDAQLIRLAKYALSLSAPSIAAPIYVELAGRDQEKRSEWLAEAAKWYMASGSAKRASELYLELMELTPDPQQRVEFLERAFFSLLAAGQSGQAAELMAGHLQELRAVDSGMLKAGVQAALGGQRFDLAEQLVTRWRQWRPDDQDALEMEFQMRLAFGDVEHAWASGQALLNASPEDAALLEKMAKLAEWTGHPREALDYWIRLLAIDEDNTENRDHAWRLAAQLFDFDHAIPLLARLADKRRLSDEELNTIVYSHQSRGTPEQGESWLREYVRHYPDHSLAWQRLQQILENTQQFRKEAEIWAEMDRRFGLTNAQRLSWAEAYWQLFDVASAYAVLEAVDDPQAAGPEYWLLRGDLAWELERDDEALDAYEHLQAFDRPLSSTAEERLITLYSTRSPDKALKLLTASWQRSHDPQRLSSALYLAEQLQDWAALQALVEQAQTTPGSERIAPLLSARALLATRAGDNAEAERLYKQGLKQFPSQGVFRQGLLWLYVELGRREELPALLQRWQSIAQQDSGLWLPFAAANQQLNRSGQALAWFRLYLDSNPRDWLVRAAYADALENAGYADKAMRLRNDLLKHAKPQPGAVVERYSMYLRLISSAQSPLKAGRQAVRWQDGSQPMLQVWFEQFMGQLDSNNQQAVKDQWLAWARKKGLQVSEYEQLQEALRNQNRGVLEKLLAGGGLDDAQHVETLTRLGRSGEALGLGLASLSDEQPAVVRQQLLRQTVELHERMPQGIQVGWQNRDFGGLDVKGSEIEVARHLGNDWYANLHLSQVRYDAQTLDDKVLGSERNARLTLQREVADGAYGLTLDSSWRDDKDRLGFGLSRTVQLSSRDEVQLALDWHREADTTGLMRALGMRDGLSIAGRHNLTARDQVIWSAAHNRYATRQGDALGSGQQVNVELNHTLQFEGPTWQLRSGLSYQRNSVNARLDESLLSSRFEADADGNEVITPLGGALRVQDGTPATLLQDRYGELYVGSSWRRGLPGALNRGKPQYTWLVDTLAGWQWQEKTFNYAINTGLGIEVLGNDELAFTVGYQSAPQSGDGEPGGTLGVTYSTRFGR